MPISSDFSIARATKNIRHVSGSTNYSVIELHRWLQDVADDASYAGNDELDMTDGTPSERSTDNIITLINGYNIDDDASQYLYNGSIIQDGGNVIYDGILVYASAGMYLNIIQNGALATNFWTTGINADSANGISHRFLLKVRSAGTDIDGRRLIATTREFGYTYSEFKVNGTSRGNNVVALTYATDLNNQTASGTVAGWTDITNTSVGYNGIDVNNNGADEFFFSEWNKASRTINQFYERMKYLTRRGESTTLYGVAGQLFRGITHEITVDNPSVTDFNAVEAVSWSGGTGQMLAINDVNAPTKMWIQLLTGVAPTDGQTITGTTSTATCDVNVTVTERTISQPFCGVSTGSAIIGSYGFGIEATDLTASDILFDLNNTSYSPPNFQTGSVAGLNITGTADKVTVGPLGYRFAWDTEAGTPPFVVGETLTFTSPAGTAVLAELFDNGTTGFMNIGPMVTGAAPTDNSTITGGTSGCTAIVNGAVSQHFNVRQLTLNGALTGAAVTSVVVNGSIPTDTPNTGTIRIKRASGEFTRHSYTAWSGSTFTIGSTDFSSNNAANGNQVWISYIDKTATATTESFTAVYTTARDMFVRVRNGATGYAIKTFETTASFGSGGFSVTASRIADE